MGNRAITVNYVPDGETWRITVTEGDHTEKGTAAGLIAARAAADRLVAKIDPDEIGRHVVHLIDGDAFAFTSAYLHARHGLPPADTTPSATTDHAAATADQATDNHIQVAAVPTTTADHPASTNGTATNETPTTGAPTTGAAANGAAASGAAASGAVANGAVANGTPANGTATNGTAPRGTPANGTAVKLAPVDTGAVLSAVATVPGSKMITVPTGSVTLAAPAPEPEQHPV